MTSFHSSIDASSAVSFARYASYTSRPSSRCSGGSAISLTRSTASATLRVSFIERLAQSVRKAPGSIALTRIPNGATSFARPSVSASSANFEEL